MEWSDDAIVLSLRAHGESSGILEALTRDHGRHLGLVRGGSSSKGRAVLQPGNRVRLVWRARLSEHLGIFTVELALARCAATGSSEDLIYVSPRTGRAVSREAGEPYRNRLLSLPAFLLGRQAGEPRSADLLAGLQLTAHFLDQWLLMPHDKMMPEA